MSIWSNTDFPYQCLRDTKRTTAMRTAIHSVVCPGDTVLDAGAGSGILALFAAEVGAAKVYAVEVDSFLARSLTRSVHANNLTDVVTVLQGDIRSIPLPLNVDVCICEMMDTGLMDEMQVPVINMLHEKGVIGPYRKMIPFQYDTFVELGSTDFSYYGFTIFAPKHDWPYYATNDSGWSSSDFHPICEPQLLHSAGFARPIDCDIDLHIFVNPKQDGLVNAIRISAQTHLANDMILGATNALNGDKILPVEPCHVRVGQVLQAHIAYRMGGGLESLQVSFADDISGEQG